MDKKFNFGTYVPKAFRELATEEERNFSEWVINFKDGQKAQLKEGAQMVINKLRQWYGDKARELVVVPVPCSSMAQYRYRFAYFCVVVANTLGQLNPMQHVTILGKRTAAHRNPAHTVQEDNYQVQIDAAFFKGKKVDLNMFKKIASKYSENKETKKAKGYVGKVLLGHSLPYGIGFVSRMFMEFNSLEDGSISPIIRSESTGRYHVFYRESFVPPVRKPFDRVRKVIERDLATTANYELDSNYVLVTKNGEPAIREKDVIAVYDDNSAMLRSRRSHDQIVNALALQLAFASEAREVGLDHSWEYRAMKRQSDVDYVIKLYKHKVLTRVSVPEDSLKALYARMGNPAHPNMGYEESRAELSDWFVIPENLMKRTYYYAEEDYLPKTYEEAKKQVFESAYLTYRSGRWDKEVVTSWGTAKVDLFADNITLLPQEWSVDLAVRSADSLYAQAKSIEKAYLAWSGIRDRYVDIDSVARRATFELAHIFSDRENFNEAQREYRAFYKTWPDSPDAEKAMFSRGFILNENLHKDDEALKVFEEFKKLYPKSELNESVDWLVQNIKSNGKLADDLMKKIAAEE